jgi:hypothetical protein
MSGVLCWTMIKRQVKPQRRYGTTVDTRCQSALDRLALARRRRSPYCWQMLECLRPVLPSHPVASLGRFG